MRYLAILLLATTVLMARGLEAQDQALSLDSMGGVTGSTVSSTVRLDALTGQVSGWTLGVCHDDTKLQLVEAVEGPVFSILGAPAFFSTVEDSALANQGWYASGILDPVDPMFPGGLPAGDYELYTCTYDIIGAGPDTSSLDFCSTLGSPPIANVIVVALGSVTPSLSSGAVTIESPDFRRSDCDQSGGVDITDVVVALYFVLGLLDVTEEPTCGAACDSNGDGGVDLTDVAFLLDHLFEGGPLVGPVACGPDPLAMIGNCASYSSCP